MTTISATTVLRSRNKARPDKVLSTLLLRYPRWIHAEQRTHRIIPLLEGEDDAWEPSTPSVMADPNLSRNAASSRAIPVKKLIDDIIADPAIPLFWGKNQKGMQADEECNTDIVFERARDTGGQTTYTLSREDAWRKAMRQAIDMARRFDEAGYHKQIVNRLLEPFSHITVLVSATEWGNFLELRDHGDAEPHIQLLAKEIRKCLDDDVQELNPGEWHLPFITDADRWTADAMVGGMEALKTVSVARCASTSYKTVDGFDMTFEKAQAITTKLAGSKPVHASPFEHVAQADDWWVDLTNQSPDGGWWKHAGEHGNFSGFRQLRFTVC